MALPTAYLTSVKNLEGIFNAIQGAQAPEKFTVKFLEGLGFKGNADRLILGLLKALNFLDDGGRPTKRYFEFLDQSQGAKILGQAIQEAYVDLFRVNIKANSMSQGDLVNKLKTLSEGKLSDSVAKKMAMTFLHLCKHADFSGPNADSSAEADTSPPEEPSGADTPPVHQLPQAAPTIGGLVYNIQIVLPDSRDPAVYDAIFKSLRDHLK